MYPRLLAVLLPAATLTLVSGLADARVGGLPVTGCSTCHTGGRIPTVQVSISPPLVMPGQEARITVKVPGSTGPGGIYLHAFQKGSFKDPGASLRLASTTDVVHSAPRAAAGGEVTFDIGWTAPMERGTVNIDAHVVASNGDRQIGGDGYAMGRLSLTIGCEGTEFFSDADGDGFGSDSSPRTRLCEMMPGYALKGGDCNDYLGYVFPGAPERCNDSDDDCDGMKNEGLESAMVFPDRDGDGFGDVNGQARIGCAASGFAPSRDDCNDGDRMVNPAIKETCNARDDNCDGRVDEGAKAVCGLGWCRRSASSCTSNDCAPGNPRAEECNLFDDDCDGVIDNGASCPDGKACAGGRCLDPDDAKAAQEAERMAAAADGGAPAGGVDGGAAGSGGSGAGTATGGSTGGSPGGGSTGGSGQASGGSTGKRSQPAKACHYGGAGAETGLGEDGGGGSGWVLAGGLLAALLLRRRRSR